MFTNFIYFIIVLLIFSTYQSSEQKDISIPLTFLLFTTLLFFFTMVTKFQFKRFENQMPKEGNRYTLDKKFHKLNMSLAVLGILTITADIYLLNITSLISQITIFKIIPTLQALLCLFIMMFFLSIIWIYSHDVRQKLYNNEESKIEFIIQNFSFTIPLIVPWFLIAGISDIVNILPFSTPKELIATPAGEISYLICIVLLLSVFGPVLVQKMWRCKPLNNDPYRKRIEILCEKADLKIKDILTWPIFGGLLITAGVMGLIRQFRYILVTPALLRFLTPDEFNAVVAHEIGHVKQKHMILYLLFLIGFIFFIGAIFDPIRNVIFYSKPFYLFIKETGIDQQAAFSAIISATTLFLFFIYFRIIFGYFMRNFERQADTYVYTLFENAKPLITTFTKIASISGQAPDKPNWHHFSIKERIDFLEKCEQNRTIIDSHNKKVKKGIICYIILTLFFAMIYFSNISYEGKKPNLSQSEKAIMHQLRTSPENPELFRFLGDFYYKFKDYKKAKISYSKALEIDPDNLGTLNNLAWLYATCENKTYQNPQKALELSLFVTATDKSPETMDTLAESYYINGKYKNAILTAKMALALSKKNRKYYETQLEKFLKAELRVRK